MAKFRSGFDYVQYETLFESGDRSVFTHFNGMNTNYQAGIFFNVESPSDSRFYLNVNFTINNLLLETGATQFIEIIPNIAADLPDLVARDVKVSDTTIAPNQSVTVTFDIANIGEAAAGTSTAGIYLSTNSTIDGNDTLLTTRAIGALDPNYKYNDLGVSITLPSWVQEGQTYYIGVIADVNNTVGESSGTNNESSDNINDGSGVAVNLSPQTSYTLTPASTTVEEANTYVTFTVRRSGDKPAETIYYSTLFDTASAADGDYDGLVNEALSFSSGETSKTFRVYINEDTEVEDTEHFRVMITANSGDGSSQALDISDFYITDDDAVVDTNYNLTPASTTVEEANTYVTFTVTRSGGLPSETIYFSTLYDTASAADGDYDGRTNVALSFSSGQTTSSFRVYINEDTEVEDTEHFRVMITANSGDSSSQALDISDVYITDDDSEPEGTTYSLTPASTTVEEEDGYVTFTVTRSGDKPAETIYYSTLFDTASSADGDYDGEVNTALSFSSGQTSKTFRIYINEDTEVEDTEHFRVMITANSGDSSSQALDISDFYITDDDSESDGTTYSLTPASTTVEEANTYVTFTVTRSGDTPEETIYYSTLFDTASSAAGDYDGHANTILKFSSGQTSKTFRIYINEDTEVEDTEHFRVMITANSGDSSSQALDISDFYITDDDSESDGTTYSLTPASITVEEEDGYVTFTVTRSGDKPAETIYYSTLFDTASSADGDYDGEVNTALSFSSGQTSKTFRIYINEDTEVEDTEHFRVMITANSGDSSSQALDISDFYITDDDSESDGTTYSLTPASTTVEEEDGYVTFTVTRSGDKPAATIYYSTLYDTASSAAGDYDGLVNRALSFSSGETTKTFRVYLNDDDIVENTEHFRVMITANRSDSSSQALDISDFYITDDDAPDDGTFPPKISISNASGSEGQVLKFIVSIDEPTSQDITINFTTRNGTAIASTGDFQTITNGSVIIHAGQTQAEIDVDTFEDNEIEATENFSVRLKSSTYGDFADHTGIGSISDNDSYSTNPKLNISNNSSEEGNEITFRVTLDRSVEQDISVAYTLTGSENLSDDISSPLSGEITIQAGNRSGLITINTIDDTLTEGSEFFNINIQTSPEYEIEDGNAVGTIIDNDTSDETLLEDLIAQAVELENTLGDKLALVSGIAENVFSNAEELAQQFHFGNSNKLNVRGSFAVLNFEYKDIKALKKYTGQLKTAIELADGMATVYEKGVREGGADVLQDFTTGVLSGVGGSLVGLAASNMALAFLVAPAAAASLPVIAVSVVIGGVAAFTVASIADGALDAFWDRYLDVPTEYLVNTAVDAWENAVEWTGNAYAEAREFVAERYDAARKYFENLTDLGHSIGTEIVDVVKGTFNNDFQFGLGGNDFLVWSEGEDTVDGGEGNDWYDIANATKSLFVDLGTGISNFITGENAEHLYKTNLDTARQYSISSIGNENENDVLVSIENVIGSKFADVILGNVSSNIIYGREGADNLSGDGGNDFLIGGADADIIDGGEGFDTADYSTSTEAVIVRLWNGTGTGGDAEGDTLRSIESVVGSGFADTLIGANSTSDVLRGGDSADSIYGLSGNDTLAGEQGADYIDGGEGYDVADYSDSSEAVLVRLWNGTGEGGDAQGDTLVSIEGLRGSGFSDTLIGQFDQNDNLYGGDGNDGLYGLSGDDYLQGGAGADILDGGTGSDTADYSTSDGGVLIRLWNGTGEGGHAQGDTLSGIENVAGSHFADTLIGSNDVNNDLQGGRGADNLFGLSGLDSLSGGDGNDILNGGTGADVLDGGDGFDMADYSDSSDSVVVRLWNGTGEGGAAQGDTLTNIEGLIGSAFSDVLIGEYDGADDLRGGAGDDQLYALSGDDTLIGGQGADILDGGAGTDVADYRASGAAVVVRLWNGTGIGGDAEGDTLAGIENLIGSAFDDTLIGSNGVNNTLSGGSGSDFLIGLTGVDTLYGGDGEDILIGGADADNLDGGAGIDTADYADSDSGVLVRLWNGTGQGGDAEGDSLTAIENIIGSNFNDTLIGANGVENFLDGGTGDDFLYGLTGDDILRGGEGADILDGGEGADVADYSSSTSSVLVRLWNGSGEGGHAQGDTLTSIESVIGSAYSDTLIGEYERADILNGGAGEDLLYGLSGDDRLIGGVGADTLDGGAGTDTADYSSSGAGVTIRLWTGTGIDGGASQDTLVSIENITGSGFADTLIGDNNIGNVLDGGAGDDFLYGLAGDDLLMGGLGADVIDGGIGIDTADYSTSTGGVLVRLWNGTGVGGDAEGDSLSDVENITGSTFSDTLIGSDNVVNTLSGGAGADGLYGLSGDDTLIGGAGADILDGGTGTDTADYSASGASVFVRLWNGSGEGGDAQGDTLASIENVTGSRFGDVLIGDSQNANTLSGGEGGDALYGLAGADMLLGGAGNDTLDGGLDDDTLTGGTGADSFVYDLGDGADTVTDFNTAVDKLIINGLSDGTTSQNVLDMITEHSTYLLLDMGNGSSMRLDGVALTDLGVANIEIGTTVPVAQETRNVDDVQLDRLPHISEEIAVSAYDAPDYNIFAFKPGDDLPVSEVIDPESFTEFSQIDLLVAEFFEQNSSQLGGSHFYQVNEYGVVEIITPDDLEYWDLG